MLVFEADSKSSRICRFYPASRCISCVLSLAITRLLCSSPKQDKRAPAPVDLAVVLLCVAVTCETSGYQP